MKRHSRLSEKSERRLGGTEAFWTPHQPRFLDEPSSWTEKCFNFTIAVLLWLKNAMILALIFLVLFSLTARGTQAVGKCLNCRKIVLYTRINVQFQSRTRYNFNFPYFVIFKIWMNGVCIVNQWHKNQQIANWSNWLIESNFYPTRRNCTITDTRTSID